MSRRVLVPASAFVAVFAVTSVMVGSISVASVVVPAIVVGLLWIVARDVRRAPWSASQQQGHDAAYTAAAFVALHGASQGGADCPSGVDGFSGCDGGGGGF
jgi:hypothetical protein